MADETPKTSPSVVAIIADLALREGSAMARRTFEQRLTMAGYNHREIRKILAGKGFGKRFAAAAITRLATRSIPGALAVGGGLAAKAMIDSRLRKKREAEADIAVEDDAQEAEQA